MAIAASSKLSNPGGRAMPPPSMGTAAPKGGVLGLLPELSRDPLGFLTRCTRDYGDFVPMRLGVTPAVVIGHPDLIEEVLVTRNSDYRKSASTRRLGSLLGNGLLLSEGEFWLRQRRLMQPAFHRQRLAAMSRSMVEITDSVISEWHNGEVRPINREMTEITLRIVGRTLFGMDVGEDLATIRRASVVMNAHFRSRLFTLLILLPDTVPTPGNLRYQAMLRDLERLVFRILRERRESGEAGDDLLGMLLSARDETGQGMSDRQLRDEVLTLLLAGHDTTALALTWAWVLLARHPEVKGRLFEEVQDALNGRAPTVNDMPRLGYVEHVIAETLRIYPTAYAIGREAIRDTVIGGRTVRKGTSILIIPWVLHRDPRFFEDPETFRPERWSNGYMESLPRYAYIPFGAGQRVCIGSSFAQMEAALIMTSIAQRFDLQLEDPSRDVEPWPVVTLRTRADVPMRIIARNQQVQA